MGICKSKYNNKNKTITTILDENNNIIYEGSIIILIK